MTACGAGGRVGRNAATLARGGGLVEPLALARHCAGRANEDGLLPEEDEVGLF